MEAKAVLKTVRIAPRKTRLIIDLIRGKSVAEARSILANQPQRAARVIEKVLNSSVAQFFYEKQFNSIKVLRSHLEQIPIPFVDNIIQKNIENLVDEILVSSDERYNKLCNDLDLEISKLYGLTNEEVSLLK